MIDKKRLLDELIKYMTDVYDCPLSEVSEYQRTHEDNVKVSYIIEGLCEAGGIIDEQPTVSEWTPTSDKLPFYTGYYLVTIKGFNRAMYAWWIATEMKWQYLNSQKDIDDVVAWMELPKPYEEK